MEKKTIDHLLRATWQAIARMYNEEASKYNSTMATGFALLSICLLYTSPSPRDYAASRMPSSA